MPVICEDISTTELTHVRYVGVNKIPAGLNANTLKPSVMRNHYHRCAEAIESIKLYKEDVLVSSFPKSGTTWTQEMVWLIVNNLDYTGAKTTLLDHRYKLLELAALMLEPQKFIGTVNYHEMINSLPPPKFIKTHLPVALLPSDFWTVKPKLVYVTRNPKAIAVSYYHHYINLFGYKGTMEAFLDLFLSDLVLSSPVHDHVLDYWRLRNEPNILFITYEEMSKNLPGVIRNVADFFGKIYGDEQVEHLAKHLSFDEMRTNESVNAESMIRSMREIFDLKVVKEDFRFIRCGKINSYEHEMPVEYQKRFDEWTQRELDGTGFNFET